jgi:LysR family transcriptional regulator, cyn operon transcriptional activator
MELRQLRYFVAVANLGSVTLASERLFVTQPALSRQIQTLEREIGISLFERKNKRLTLTDAGQLFLTQAQGVLQQIEKTRTVMEEARKGTSGFLRVAAPPITMRYVVLSAIAAFRQLWPSVDVQISEVGKAPVMSLVEHGDIDLGVGAPITGLRNLRWEPLYTARWYALLAPTHPLAGHTSLTVEELAREQLLLFKSGQASHFLWESVIPLHGLLGGASVFESDVAETIFSAAELQLGIAIVSDTVPHPGNGLTTIPALFNGLQLESSMGVAWHTQRRLGEATKDFIRILKAEAERRPTAGYAPWQTETDRTYDAQSIERYVLSPTE